MYARLRILLWLGVILLQVPFFQVISGAIDPPMVTIYVDSSYLGKSDGSFMSPYKAIKQGLSALEPGGELLIKSGLYYIDDFEVPVTLSGLSENHRTYIGSYAGVVVLTRPDGYAPFVHFQANHSVLDGLWFVGKRDGDEPENAIHNGGSPIGYDKHFYNNVFVGYPGGIGQGSAKYYFYVNNTFINCGKGYFSHPIYISGGHVEGSMSHHIYFLGNQVLFSQGWGIHLWHLPKNVVVINNFLARNDDGIVIHGYGNVLANNLVWSTRWNSKEPQRPQVGAWVYALDSITSGNIFGPGVETVMWQDLEYPGQSMWPEQSVYFVPKSQKSGSDFFVSPDDMNTYLGFNQEEMEAVLDELEAAFAQGPEEVFANSDGISNNLDELNGMYLTLPLSSPMSGTLPLWYSVGEEITMGSYGPSSNQPMIEKVWDILHNELRVYEYKEYSPTLNYHVMLPLVWRR